MDDDNGEGVDVAAEDHVVVEGGAVDQRVENEEEEEALLIRGDRAVRGVIGEQGDLAGRLHPDVPATHWPSQPRWRWMAGHRPTWCLGMRLERIFISGRSASNFPSDLGKGGQ